MSAFQSILDALKNQRMPPLERWNPTDIKDFDVFIDLSGKWHHEGKPFERQSLVNLLATVLVKEEGEYFLKSPQEMLRIRVGDAPLIVTDFEYSGKNDSALMVIDTNVGIKSPVNSDHPIRIRKITGREDEAPYVEMQNGVEARFSTSAYYRLVELCKEAEEDPQSFGFWSGGVFHSLIHSEQHP